MAEQNNQPAQEMTQQELSEQIKIRREKLAQLQAEGKDPFEITKCEVTAMKSKTTSTNWKAKTLPLPADL